MVLVWWAGQIDGNRNIFGHLHVQELICKCQCKDSSLKTGKVDFNMKDRYVSKECVIPAKTKQRWKKVFAASLLSKGKIKESMWNMNFSTVNLHWWIKKVSLSLEGERLFYCFIVSFWHHSESNIPSYRKEVSYWYSYFASGTEVPWVVHVVSGLVWRLFFSR